ncbi:hypothetical protein TCAL_12584 [Tigriopus californicus]|uniref:ZP domain-containing protein n=1 Tax=Tigriopus californicus TaxID=6832 RepID=A0A553NDT8_TIGCA|nr:hypothetical protein TCAL_12584 [Tigriopus californicus]|eukprot:TCALIF_12584-PA protein Name:"Protein of unknown function" AED:0.05 eAED:0.19 QI:0/0.66/0.5/1/0.33/0.25/4/35/655
MLGALLLGIATLSAHKVECATNYQDQAISIPYNSSFGLPTFGTLNGTVTELDVLSAAIKLNRTNAHLNCASGFMKIDLTFEKEFYGIVYPDFDRNSPLRFHPDLEIDGDEVITLVCRYPPPIAPAPIVPVPLLLPPPEATPTLKPLREFEILLIICAIIFLALMLLGIGCSYYCLKKRNIKVVRRKPASSLGSDVTKISEPVSLFSGLKIPRAHALDESGSEEVAESVNTEIHSDINSILTEDEYTSAYSDKMCILSEGRVQSKLHDPPAPTFDIRLAVNNVDVGAFTPTPSVVSSDADTMLQAQEQYLTTILERTETNTRERLEHIRRQKQHAGPPPVHARINVSNAQITDQSEVESLSEYSRAGTEAFSDQDLELESREIKSFSVLGVTDTSRTREQMSAGPDQGAYSKDEKNFYDRVGHQHQHLSRQDRQGQRQQQHRQQQQQQHVLEEQRMDSSWSFESRQMHDMEETRHMSHTEGAIESMISPNIVRTAASTYSTDRPKLSNFDVLIRIIENNDSFQHVGDDSGSSIFTEEERINIKDAILEDTRLRTHLERTVQRSDVLQLWHDSPTLQSSISPEKWNVVIRIFNSHDDCFAEVDRESSNSSVTQNSYGFSGAHQSIQSTGLRSVADRSATEITEFHHVYSQKMDWTTD